MERGLLARYFQQLSELGEHELFLETLTAEAAVAAVALASGKASVTSVPEAARGAVASVEAAEPGAEPSEAERLLRSLGGEAARCMRCRLHQTRRTVVFGDGSAAADVVVVGEAPGAEEDRTGLPFVGPAGKLLDLLLLSAGFPRERVYICNVLKCRPPENRDPRPDEVAACSGYLKGQLEIIRPGALLAVGKFAAQTLLESEQSIGRLRGHVHAYQGVPVVVTYHPAFLLRSSRFTRTTWEDFQLLRTLVDRAAG